MYGHKEAISEAEKLQLIENSHYHGLLGYLYTNTEIDKPILHYEQAIKLTRSKAEKQTLTKEIKRLKEQSSK